MATTDVEYVLNDSGALISKSDLNGNITYVNQDFVNISGYAEEEVLGGPQSILAHPDAPKQAFEDFLRTVKASKAWTAVVKGRQKNGDHFWVEMTAAPIFENYRAIGHTCIRTQPSRENIRAADMAYKAMKADSRELEMNEGRIVKRSVLRRFLALTHPAFVALISASSALLSILFLANLLALLSRDSPANG